MPAVLLANCSASKDLSIGMLYFVDASASIINLIYYEYE
jgi:hypothetical protein